MWTSSVLLFVYFSYVLSSSLPLPPYVKACKRDSPDLDACALEHGKLALPYILKGDPKYGIPNFYPLKINEISLETSGNLALKLKDIEVFGLDKTILKRIKMDLAVKKFFIDFAVDEIVILGTYDIDGKLLVLPIKGHGDANITAKGGDFQYEFKYKNIIKDGEKYITAENQHLEFTLTRMYLNFDNLFNGDPVLGPNTNKVLNEEWQSVFKDIKPAVEKAILAIASSIINNIFENVPHKFIVL